MKILLRPKNILSVTFYAPLKMLLEVNLTDIDIIHITDNK